jgi:hypothetical protein
MTEITAQEMDLMFSLVEGLIVKAARIRSDREFNECLNATARVMDELRRTFDADAAYIVLPAEDLATALHMLAFFRTWIDRVTPTEPDGHELKRDCAHAVDYFACVLSNVCNDDAQYVQYAGTA